jgi:hypothetical protein
MRQKPTERWTRPDASGIVAPKLEQETAMAGGYDYSCYECLGLSQAEGILTVTLSNPGARFCDSNGVFKGD